MKRRIGIMISGRGSNMQSIIQSSLKSDYPGEVVIVLSNNPDAAGLEYARKFDIHTMAIDHRLFNRDRRAHELKIAEELEKANVEIVCLAGYMRLLTPYLVGKFSGRILNIHPSLLPAYPGLHTHKRAIEAGEQHHGCTVHLVTEVMDEGPILGQATVDVLPNDTEDTLNNRVLKQEHILYPTVLKKFILDLKNNN